MTVWTVDPEAWARAACRIANRTLTAAEQQAYLGALQSNGPCEGAGEHR